MSDSIIIKGARENNLKNIDLSIPRDKLVIFTGLSGYAEKSSTYFILYSELVAISVPFEPNTLNI